MAITLREPCERDWEAILQLADQAVPWALEGNRVWLSNRRQFGQTGHLRRHYVAEDGANGIIGYGGIEGEAEPGRFRLFLVMTPERLHHGLGQMLYERLHEDLSALKARVVWVREEAADTALLSFLKERGFAEEQRFSAAGVEIIVLASGEILNAKDATDEICLY